MSTIRMVFLIAGLMTMGFACQQKKTPTTNENHPPSHRIEDHGVRSDLQATLNLKSLVPLSKGTLKILLPEKVGEYIITQTLIGHKEPIEISAIQGTYHHRAESSKTILIDIMDGAGPVASVLLSGSIHKLNLDFEEVKPDGFSRILERKGQRVWEAENRKEGIAELEYIHAGRFLVSIKGTHLQHADLWDFTDKLDFNNLQ